MGQDLLQTLIVALIVSSAMLYSTWRWMPKQWRTTLAASLAGYAVKLGIAEKKAQKLSIALSQTKGCSNCDSCGSCAPPAQTATQSVTFSEPQEADNRKTPIA